MSLTTFCYKIGFFHSKNPRNLDPSYKTDLDLWELLKGENKTNLDFLDFFGNDTTSSYN